MKATLVFISKNPEYGIVSVKSEKAGFGFMKEATEIASGWAKIEEGTEVGDSFDLPDTVKVTTVKRGDFEWLVLS